LIRLDKFHKILEILEDEQKSAEVIEAARTSMGMEISELDLQNIDLFAKRVAALAEYRQRLHQYIKVFNKKIQLYEYGCLL
jgi:nucleolar protein 56